MIYQKLSATFGALKHQTLTLQDGLNVISGANESGKSTWSAFVRVMLYGIATRERSTKDALPDKEKYAPWSGEPMYGKLELKTQGRNLCIERTAGKRDRFFKNLDVTDLQTGLSVDLAGQTPGEAFLGVKSPVFERSALTGQGQLTVANDDKGELLRRIQSLAQTGDEDTSFTMVKARLEAWKRERRYNKRGKLAELETERDQLTGILFAQREESERLTALKARRNERKGQIEVLSKRRDAHRATRAAQKLAAIRAAEQACAGLSAPDEAELAALDSLEQAAVQAEAAYTACLEQGEPGGVSRETWVALVLGLLVGAGLGLGLWVGTHQLWAALAAGVIGTGAVFGIGSGLRSAKQRRARTAEIAAAEHEREEHRAALSQALLSVAPDATDVAAVHLRAQEVRLAQERLALLTQGVDRDKLEELAARADACGALGNEEEDERALREMELDLQQMEHACIALETKLEHSGNAKDMNERIVEIDSLLAQGEREVRAIERALTVLSESNGELTQRIAPLLSARAGALFSEVTGGRFDTIELKEGLALSVREAGVAEPRSLLSLSTGTLDELYLCLRLALCESLFEDEPAPILLDDALVNYDDMRAARMLELLKKLAETRQIILFTCHTREHVYFEQDPDVHCVAL